jgi:hypothetical protein
MAYAKFILFIFSFCCGILEMLTRAKGGRSGERVIHRILFTGFLNLV